MRQIKFKAWDKKLKKWNISVEIDCFGNIQEYKFNEKAYYPKFFTPEKDTLEEGTERFDLVQFTGLLDKNGKEIYEGDIMDWGHGRYIYIVFEEGVFQAAFKDGTTNKLIYYPNRTVVGNIYENKELLK